MALTPAPFDLNFAGSGFAPNKNLLLVTNFCVPKKYFDHCKTKKFSFLACKIISKIIIFSKLLKLLEPGAALIYASSDSIPMLLKCSGSRTGF